MVQWQIRKAVDWSLTIYRIIFLNKIHGTHIDSSRPGPSCLNGGYRAIH